VYTSLTGNLALTDGARSSTSTSPSACGMDPARGGHLFEATVRPTAELVLTTSPGPERRKIDRETHLRLLDP
jgi:predicted DNA-binding protein with PD1-like motif